MPFGFAQQMNCCMPPTTAPAVSSCHNNFIYAIPYHHQQYQQMPIAANSGCYCMPHQPPPPPPPPPLPQQQICCYPAMNTCHFPPIAKAPCAVPCQDPVLVHQNLVIGELEKLYTDCRDQRQRYRCCIGRSRRSRSRRRRRANEDIVITTFSGNKC